MLVWRIANSLLCSAAEASVGSQQASAGGCVLSVCNAGRGGLHRTCAILGLHPRDPGLRFQQVPGQCTQMSLLKVVSIFRDQIGFVAENFKSNGTDKISVSSVFT